MTSKDKRVGIIGGLIFIGLGLTAIMKPDLLDGGDAKGRRFLVKWLVMFLWSRPFGAIAVVLGCGSIWNVIKSSGPKKTLVEEAQAEVLQRPPEPVGGTADGPVERNRGNNKNPRIDISDEFDQLVKQLHQDESEEMRYRFWRRICQLERIYLVCPLDTPDKPDLQYFALTENRPEVFVTAFTNEAHATAYAVRKGFVSTEGKLNLMVMSASRLLDFLSPAKEQSLYGVYFNILTMPFHTTLSNLQEVKYGRQPSK